MRLKAAFMLAFHDVTLRPAAIPAQSALTLVQAKQVFVSSLPSIG